ncbi:thioesterase domain-containing protein [Bacillus velezensis]|uniref:thioesterase domain-containing protein n=1 Tax=Bacillus velezensis TaxID=492670 RepID=UPI00218A3F9B
MRIYIIIKNNITEPFAIFEHSMGGLLTYELCHKFQNEGNPALMHICLRRKAPQLKGRKRLIHIFPKHGFISDILKLDGTGNLFGVRRYFLADF